MGNKILVFDDTNILKVNAILTKNIVAGDPMSHERFYARMTPFLGRVRHRNGVPHDDDEI